MHAETVARVLDRLHVLAPQVEGHRERMDCERRLPSPLLAALADAGLFRLWLPKSLGGPELSAMEFMEVVESAAALDASIGWVVGNGAGASRIAGYLDEGAAREWFADPRAFIVTATGAVGRAVPVTGGYRVTGLWPFGSGIHGATGVAGLCGVEDDGPPRTIMCLAQINAAAIHDTWHVSGLRGTGSHDWALEDVFVPTAHSFSFPDHEPRQPGILYRIPALSTFAWSVSVVPLAIARAALDGFATAARSRVRVGSSQVLAEREWVQAEVGRADAAIRAGRAFLRDAMAALADAVVHGAPGLLPFRATLRQAAAHAAEAALGVAASLERLAGTAAIFESGPLARRLRDLRAAVQHVAMSPNNHIIAGRLALGLDAGTARV